MTRFDAPIDFTTESASLLKLIRERSYREGDFTLASGKKSKFSFGCLLALVALSNMVSSSR